MTAEFPRSYRASFNECFFYLLISGLGVGGGALGVWYFAGGHDPQTHGAGAVWLTTICALFVVGGGYLLYSMLSMRVTLTADTIEIQTVSETTVLRREELSSWRLLEPSKGPRILVLVPRNSLRQPVRIRQYFKMDASFLDWLAPLPNRDEQSPALSLNV